MCIPQPRKGGANECAQSLCLYKLSSKDIWLVHPMADIYFARTRTASWILSTLGVEATSDRWDRCRIAVRDVRDVPDLSYDELAALLDDGKPVLAGMIAGPDLWQLGEDEVYSCSSKVKYKDGELLKPHGYHMVVLIGHGALEISGRKLVAFLNSHGNEFCKRGCGWLFFDEVGYFLCVESDHPPIIMPHLLPKQAPATRDRRYMDEAKWRPEGKFRVSRAEQQQAEHSGRTDSTSTWRKQSDPEVTNATEGEDSSTVLKKAIVNEICALMTPGVDKGHVRHGISLAVRSALENLKGMARMISTPESITQVASHAASGDNEIGNLVFNALDSIGHGIITVMDGSDLSNGLELTSGLKLGRGLHHSVFYYQSKRQNICSKEPFYVTVHIEGEAVELLVQNQLYSNRNICVVKVPGSGPTMEHNVNSISTFTGANIICVRDDAELINLNMFGKCEMVTISKNECVMLDSIGEDSNIKMRAELLANITGDSISSCIETIQQKELANLFCHVAVLKIGGASREEIDEKKSKVTLALLATKSALEAGVVPGNGLAYLYATKDLPKLVTENPGQKIGVRIIENALRVPAYTFPSNEGLIKEGDIYAGQYVDIWEGGLIEPYEQIKTYLEAVEMEASNMLMA